MTRNSHGVRRTLTLGLALCVAGVLPACGAAPPREALVATARDLYRVMADGEIAAAAEELELHTALEKADAAGAKALMRKRLLDRRDGLRRVLAENRRGEFEAQLTMDQKRRIEDQVKALEVVLLARPAEDEN